MIAYQPAGYCPHCGYQVDAGRCSECGRVVTRPLRVPPGVLRRRLVIRVALGLALVGLLVTGYVYRADLAVRFVPTRLVDSLRGRDSATQRWWFMIFDEQLRLAMEAEEPAHAARKVAIEAELATLRSHEWAGRYESSDSRMSLAPGAGYSYVWGSCESFGSFHGEVEFATPDVLTLRCVPALREFRSERLRLLRVPWQGHHYLISPSRVAHFANCINSRNDGAPRWFLHRRGDRTTPEPKLPQLPEPYSAYIRREPLIADVTNVIRTGRSPDDDSGKCWDAEVVLNVGAADDVFVGMKLYGTHRHTYLGATVYEVREHECMARFTDCFDECESVDLPKAGWQFMTLGPEAEMAGEFNLRNIDGWANGVSPSQPEPGEDEETDENPEADEEAP